MKMITKRIKVWLPVQFLILATFLFPQPLVAQGTLNALTYISPSPVYFGQGGIHSYVVGGVGWSFVPTSDLLVTSVYTYDGTQVTFWQGPSQIISNIDYPSLSGSFQPIAPLLLSAGQTYFISSQNSNLNLALNVVLYSDELSPFTNSPYITQFENYQFSQSAQWSPFPDGANASVFSLGPNFQFQVVPEPTAFELLVLAFGIWILRDQKVFESFHARKIL